jgi:hypothetical protein
MRGFHASAITLLEVRQSDRRQRLFTGEQAQLIECMSEKGGLEERWSMKGMKAESLGTR